MTKYLLVAASHDYSGPETRTSGSPESMPRFRCNIEALLTGESLVLSEGFSHEGLIHPGHQLYKRVHTDLLGLPDTKRPVIGGFDPRTKKILMRGERDDSDARYERFEALAESLVFTPDRIAAPKTLNDALKVLREGLPPAQLRRRPAPDEVELARWVRARNRRFDRCYLQAMQKYGRRFDICLFIGGAVHSLSMAQQSDYELVDFVPASDTAGVFFSYLVDHVWSKLFLETEP